MLIHHRFAIGASAAALAFSIEATAQVPGAPVLQNAFTSPGLAFAANFGSGSGQSYFGAAAAWGPGSGRFQLSGAAGVQRINDATRGAYGGKVAASVWTSSGGALGAGAFAGFGGAVRTRDNGVVTNPSVLHVPIGASVGYRRALGSTRGISAYVSPMFRFTRLQADEAETSNGFAVAGGIDFAVTRAIGVTIGGEFGKAQGDEKGTGLFGGAVSFVTGR